MKKLILSIICLIGFNGQITFAQCDGQKTEKKLPTSIGMVISTNDVETVWNALRLANFSKDEGDTIKIFLLGKGVEVEILVKENTDIKEQAEKFLDSGGIILGCGTCLTSRKNDNPQVCKFSSMADLYSLIRSNKIVLTF